MKMPKVTITGVGHRMGDDFVTIASEGGASVKVRFRTQVEAIVFDDALREALADLLALERTSVAILGPNSGQCEPNA